MNTILNLDNSSFIDDRSSKGLFLKAMNLKDFRLKIDLGSVCN